MRAADLVRALRRERELDVDRRRRVLFVLDFRFGERRAAVDAPVDGLLALVDQPGLDELTQRARDRRLVLERHRQVRVLPVAEDPEPLEFLRHHADEARRVRAARAAEVGDAHVALLRAEFAIDLQLDRQAVAVVARHVGRVEAGHRSRLDDEVLEDLVERRAEMDLPVGVRRTVVEDELRASLPRRADLPVEVHRRPSRERLRLGGRQVGLHREPRAGQVERVLPVGHAISCNCTAKKAGRPGGRPAFARRAHLRVPTSRPT